MRSYARRFAIAALASAALVPAAKAQDQWEHTLAGYMFGAGLDGRSQLGLISTEIDASFSDIVENLEFGAMAAYRAQSDSIAVTVDALFVGLGGQDTGPLGSEFDVDVDQIIVGADIAFRTSQAFEFLVGARYMSMDMTLTVTTPGGASASGSEKEDWIDPYVGALVTLPMSDTWSFTLRGDIGGFGVGSDLAWNAVARFNWKVSEHGNVLLGYRILDVDYENGSGSDLFVFDAAMSGPFAGFAWAF